MKLGGIKTSIAFIATISRVFCLSWTFFWNLAKPGDDDTSILLSLPNNNDHPLLRKFVVSFTQWDSTHFFNIAKNGYLYEHQHAFFPLYPHFLRFLHSILKLSDLSTLLVGIITSNIAFILASVLLYLSVYEYTLNEYLIANYSPNSQHVHNMCKKRGFISALFFIFSFGSIFFSSNYTESLFCLLSFSICFLLERSSNIYVNEKKRFVLRWIAVVLIMTAQLLRSNANLFLIILFFATLRTSPLPFSNFYLFNKLHKRKISVIKFFIHWTNAFMQALICGIVFLSILYESGTRLCEGSRGSELSYCQSTLYHSIYGYVQKKYWKVCFMCYWTANNTMNFVLASFVVFLCVCSIVYSIRKNKIVSYSLAEERVIIPPKAVPTWTVEQKENEKMQREQEELKNKGQVMDKKSSEEIRKEKEEKRVEERRELNCHTVDCVKCHYKSLISLIKRRIGAKNLPLEWVQKHFSPYLSISPSVSTNNYQMLESLYNHHSPIIQEEVANTTPYRYGNDSSIQSDMDNIRTGDARFPNPRDLSFLAYNYSWIHHMKDILRQIFSIIAERPFAGHCLYLLMLTYYMVFIANIQVITRITTSSILLFICLSDFHDLIIDADRKKKCGCELCIHPLQQKISKRASRRKKANTKKAASVNTNKTGQPLPTVDDNHAENTIPSVTPDSTTLKHYERSSSPNSNSVPPVATSDPTGLLSNDIKETKTSVEEGALPAKEDNVRTEEADLPSKETNIPSEEANLPQEKVTQVSEEINPAVEEEAIAPEEITFSADEASMPTAEVTQSTNDDALLPNKTTVPPATSTPRVKESSPCTDVALSPIKNSFKPFNQSNELSNIKQPTLNGTMLPVCSGNSSHSNSSGTLKDTHRLSNLNTTHICDSAMDDNETFHYKINKILPPPPYGIWSQNQNNKLQLWRYTSIISIIILFSNSIFNTLGSVMFSRGLPWT